MHPASMSLWRIYDSRMLDGIYTILTRNKDDDRRLMRLDRVLAGHLGHAVAREVERAKIALSDRDDISVPLDWIERGFAFDATREQLNDTIAGLLDDAEVTLVNVIRSSGVPAKNIGVVFFTGGGSLLPEVRTRVRRLLPHAAAFDTDQFGGDARGGADFRLNTAQTRVSVLHGIFGVAQTLLSVPRSRL